MAELLFEVGTEELPASFVEPALEELERRIREGFAEARLPHGDVRALGTPRRLALIFSGLADRAEDQLREVLGPPSRVAKDEDGQWTKAALKFAEGQGVSMEALTEVDTPKGAYLAVKLEEKGRTASDAAPEILSAALHQLGFRKSMRWGDVELSFGRPLQWLVALLDEEVVPVVFGDVRSGRVSRGHRFLAPEPLPIARPADYERLLTGAHVIADPVERRRVLEERVREAAREAGGVVREDPALFEEVTYLVEQPSPVVGSFDERHLELPPEVLVQEMRGHQRYFAMVDAEGKLLPRFIAVSNTPVRDPALSLRGYERVLEARLSDGRFFFDEDRKRPLATRVDALQRVVWQGQLGSWAEKLERMERLADQLAKSAGLPVDAERLRRAVRLSKADLTTGMVGEFPELQGVMGREYALADGEDAEVALAIFEHYLPKGAGDRLPEGDLGALVGIADRLDTVCGIFAIGKPPTGAADPFAVRRACLAIVNVIIGRGYRLGLAETVRGALEPIQERLASKASAEGSDGASDSKGGGDEAGEDTAKAPKGKKGKKPKQVADPAEAVLAFFRARLKALWSEGHRADVVEAVLSAGFDDLVATARRVEALSATVDEPEFAPLAGTFKRVANIVAKQAADTPEGEVDPALLQEKAEKALWEQLSSVREDAARKRAVDDYAGLLDSVRALKAPVDAFFDEVMVMAEDEAVRNNRIRLLRSIGGLFGAVADFAQIQVE